MFGGLPLILSKHGDEQKSKYLSDLLEETYKKDVIDRYKLRGDTILDNLVDILASAVGSLTNPTKLADTFNSHGIKTNKNTIAAYANAQTVVYLNGTINDWSHSFSETYRFTLNEETGNYEFTYTFAEGDQFGLVVNPTEAAPSQTWVGVGAMGTSGDANATFAGASNFTCSVAGTYRVVYNADAGTVDIYAVTSA